MKSYFGKGVLRLREIWFDAGCPGSSLRRQAENPGEEFRIDPDLDENKEKILCPAKKGRAAERISVQIFNSRKESKDCEIIPDDREAMIQTSMISILVR